MAESPQLAQVELGLGLLKTRLCIREAAGLEGLEYVEGLPASRLGRVEPTLRPFRRHRPGEQGPGQAEPILARPGTIAGQPAIQLDGPVVIARVLQVDLGEALPISRIRGLLSVQRLHEPKGPIIRLLNV